MALQSEQDLSGLRERIRHSTTHVMADVVTTMFPDAKLAIGPPTEDGFYYDFMIDSPFTPEDLEQIEATDARGESPRTTPFESARRYSRDEDANEPNVQRPAATTQEIIDGIPAERTRSTTLHSRRRSTDLCGGHRTSSRSGRRWRRSSC